MAEQFSRFVRWLHDESGTTAIEYALIATLVGVTFMLAALNVRTELVGLFDSVTAAFY